MTQYIIALSVDKVQTLLFEVIRSHTQEKQTETATLRNIKNASWQVDQGFRNAINEEFGSLIQERLLDCSGVCIFTCTAELHDIDKKLNKLFLDYYHASQGQTLLKYVRFPATGQDKVSDIQTAKRRLKTSRCLNAIIATNREQLFQFQTAGGPDKTVYKSDDKQNYSLFVNGVNDLYCQTEQNEQRPYGENSFRIAVIKADLDGMGDLFGEVCDYDTYQTISKSLNENISLQGLHAVAETMGKSQAWIFPLYIAGDDIFFAVSVANVVNGIELCRRLVAQIREQVDSIIRRNPDDSKPRLSVSIGVEFVFNREPVRYYLDKVEAQLKKAKAAFCPKVLNGFLKAKISMHGLAFLDVDYETIRHERQTVKKRKHPMQQYHCDQCWKVRAVKRALNNVPIWQFFLSDVGLLEYIKSLDIYKGVIGNSGFFHSLLERLTEETTHNNNIRYSNSLFYHLLPKYLESNDERLRRLELLLNTAIISPLYRYFCNDKCTFSERFVLGLEVKQSEQSKKRCVEFKQRLEVYLRLLLLFSDTRFKIVTADRGSGKYDDFNDNIKQIRNRLLTKPQDYLYVQSLRQNDFLNTIIQQDSREIVQEKKKFLAPYFKHVQIEKSMFFRLRNTQKIDVLKAADMIALANPKSKDDIEIKNNERIEKGWSPRYLYFDKDAFSKKAGGQWTTEYVDSLMLLYQYIAATGDFKRLY